MKEKEQTRRKQGGEAGVKMLEIDKHLALHFLQFGGRGSRGGGQGGTREARGQRGLGERG